MITFQPTFLVSEDYLNSNVTKKKLPARGIVKIWWGYVLLYNSKSGTDFYTGSINYFSFYKTV